MGIDIMSTRLAVVRNAMHHVEKAFKDTVEESMVRRVLKLIEDVTKSLGCLKDLKGQVKMDEGNVGRVWKRAYAKHSPEHGGMFPASHKAFMEHIKSELREIVRPLSILVSFGGPDESFKFDDPDSILEDVSDAVSELKVRVVPSLRRYFEAWREAEPDGGRVHDAVLEVCESMSSIRRHMERSCDKIEKHTKSVNMGQSSFFGRILNWAGMVGAAILETIKFLAYYVAAVIVALIVGLLVFCIVVVVFYALFRPVASYFATEETVVDTLLYFLETILPDGRLGSATRQLFESVLVVGKEGVRSVGEKMSGMIWGPVSDLVSERLESLNWLGVGILGTGGSLTAVALYKFIAEQLVLKIIWDSVVIWPLKTSFRALTGSAVKAFYWSFEALSGLSFDDDFRRVKGFWRRLVGLEDYELSAGAIRG